MARPRIQRGGANLLREHLDACLAVYQAAFLDVHEPDPQRAGAERRLHMSRHGGRPGVRVALGWAGPGELVGFCYSAVGTPGSWWHDVVAAALPAQEAGRWLGCCREVVELHVLPSWQGLGLGRRLLRASLEGAVERTAVLSALDDAGSRTGRARRLYAAEGFQVLLAEFHFPGSALPYAILGRELSGAAPSA